MGHRHKKGRGSHSPLQNVFFNRPNKVICPSASGQHTFPSLDRTDEIFSVKRIEPKILQTFFHLWSEPSRGKGHYQMGAQWDDLFLMVFACLGISGKKSFVIKSLLGEDRELIDRHLNTVGKSFINDIQAQMGESKSESGSC